MKKAHVLLIVIFGVFLLVIGVLSPLFLNKPFQYDLYNFDKYVNVAQSFSGYMMPFIALLGAVLTFAAFYIQYKANERIRNQFDLEQSNSHFYRMLDIHINNVKEFEISSSYENLSEGSETNYSREKFILKQKDKSEIKHRNIERVNTKGRLCFVLMVKDLHFTIEMVKSENQNLVKRLVIELTLGSSNKDTNKIYFKKLEKNKTEIESIFGNQLEWEILPDSKMSRIKFEDTNLNLYNEDDWNQFDEFFIEHLPRFKMALEGYVQRFGCL